MKFEFLEHTADVKFRAYGKSIEEVFTNCAVALREYIAQDQTIEKRKKKEIKIMGKNNEELLHTFLDELLFLLDAEGFLIADAEIRIKNGVLHATLWGDDTARYSELLHIKAATYAEMHIKQDKQGWEAQVVLDV